LRRNIAHKNKHMPESRARGERRFCRQFPPGDEKCGGAGGAPMRHAARFTPPSSAWFRTASLSKKNGIWSASKFKKRKLALLLFAYNPT
jgi:hypothetical protein